MKKIFVLGIVVLAISLGFTACGQKGGTLKLVNDTDAIRYFKVRFDGKDVKINNGAYQIDPSQTVKAVSDEDTSYAVYPVSYSGFLTEGTKALWNGTLSGGETVELKYSQKYSDN
jgi:hypothetical protein